MQPGNSQLLDMGIEYLKGVGPSRGEMLRKELGIHNFGDLLMQFPFRYVDKTEFHRIGELMPDSGTVQLKGILRRLTVQGEGRKQRLSGVLRDASGSIELVWFKGVHWLQKNLEVGKEYVVYGKITDFRNSLNISHPEMEAADTRNTEEALTFAPVYPSTEKLNTRGLDNKVRRRLIQTIFEKLTPADVPEMIPEYIRQKLRLLGRFDALKIIHFPPDAEQLKAARNRLKFEELFLLQMRLLQLKKRRKGAIIGYPFPTIGDYFNTFYQEKLPFELTGAQKRVLREIRQDLGRPIQMNRLLQGDVGSGKTMVALMSMLMAIDNGFQACILAPTEILAQQHYEGISEYVEGLGLTIGYLSGNVRGKKRKLLLEQLAAGEIHILVGTHAVLEPPVVFQNLGLAIVDEQHRFGVMQRAKLWKKNTPYPPHILVMTATPIPRTLAMTLYGDLDVSVIDELPPGRKAIETLHKTEHQRRRVIGFMKEQIALGRQIYVVFPLIEESEKLDLQALEAGYEVLLLDFPQPQFQISVVHGRMKSDVKDFEMQRFKTGVTQIMVATTVIEVGVNVPNASVMVIENTERFGLSQLHQLRGRVGRGADQSYCILMSGFKLSNESRERIATMVRTNNGFEIAEADLRLRGPGNIEGTEQSGILNLRIADLAQDGRILQTAREIAHRILDDDPQLEKEHHRPLGAFLDKHYKHLKGWSRIS
ncbi:MAG: ATP-dependent DNA helicase RecG [Bacteroidetes bacterium]|nr:MAG: ATP-dependent DNA helicase RecG [Bacteroidota bacterium]